MTFKKGEPRPPNAGRKKGSRNRAAAALQAAVATSGMTPLDYMLSVMRDEAAPPPVRLDAARAAAPYVHPKLSSVDYQFKNLTDDELRAAIGERPAPPRDDAAGTGSAAGGAGRPGD